MFASNLFFEVFAFMWQAVLFLLMALGFLFTAFNIWMTLDALKRFKSDSGKTLLYLLLIWLLPFGWIIYYFSAVPTEERFISKTVSPHKTKLFVGVGVLLVLILLIIAGAVGATIKAKRAWDTKKTEVEEAMRKVNEEQKRMEQEREAFKEKFDIMEENVNEFNQRVTSEVEKSKIQELCVRNFYSGIVCRGTPPLAVREAAEKIGVTEDKEIKEICGCASQDSIDRFKQGF